MNCLKCGRKTDQTFCEACREEMDRYPVKPGTIVQLPKERRDSYARRGQNWRDMVPLETQIENQKRTIRRLAGAVAFLAVLVLGMGFGLFKALTSSSAPAVGQNYVAVTKPTEDATAPTLETETGTSTEESLTSEET